MTREELKGIVFKTHRPLTVEEVMFGIDKYVEQIRATMYAEIKALAEQRCEEKCNHSSCDDCECCCEVQALDWLLEKLKEHKNE